MLAMHGTARRDTGDARRDGKATRSEHDAHRSRPRAWRFLVRLRTMPPKADPYATATHRRIDALLVLLTALIALVFLGQHHRACGAIA